MLSARESHKPRRNTGDATPCSSTDGSSIRWVLLGHWYSPTGLMPDPCQTCPYLQSDTPFISWTIICTFPALQMTPSHRRRQRTDGTDHDSAIPSVTLYSNTSTSSLPSSSQMEVCSYLPTRAMKHRDMTSFSILPVARKASCAVIVMKQYLSGRANCGECGVRSRVRHVTFTGMKRLLACGYQVRQRGQAVGDATGSAISICERGLQWFFASCIHVLGMRQSHAPFSTTTPSKPLRGNRQKVL